MDIYAEVTNRIISQLEKGTVPWHKPWMAAGLAVNHVTGKPYSMLNQMMLGAPGEYLTFKQVTASGGKIKKGAKANMVVFWKVLQKPALDRNGKELLAEDGKVMMRPMPFLRYYNVFHIDDCENVKPKLKPGNAAVHADAETVLMGYVRRSGVRLEHRQQNKAYYRPSEDCIVLPERWQFESTAEYYGTAFHEAVHSTGHPSRLNRLEKQADFGSEEYSKEELVAEIGSSMIVFHTGTGDEKCFSNSVSYIGGWLKALKNDKRLIVSAASRAEKAANYILGV